jgi:hypothetical protein
MTRTLLRLAIIVAVGYTAIPIVSQEPNTNALDGILDLLLFPATPALDLNTYSASADIRTELQRYLQRYKAYRSTRQHPVRPGLTRGEESMIYSAWIAYERSLVAVTADPRASALAKEYVDRLTPCYEWEGLHDCPEREAKFASEYQESHPGGPFSDYLPLLAAHRWLCAAEGYVGHPEEAARSRTEYEQMISTARQSKSPLVRVAAERLAQRNSCFR